MKAPQKFTAVLLLTFAVACAFMAQTVVRATGEAKQETSQSAQETPSSTPPEESTSGDTVASESNGDLFAELFVEGEEYFPSTCMECHGPEGGGGVGVPLRENTQYTKYVVRAIVNGQGRMPPIAADFDARKIAAILTYVSNSWGNDYGIVTEEDVEAALAD